MTKFLLILMVVSLWSGCGGDSDSPTGPQGQALEVETEKWDNGNIKIEFQYYRDGGKVVKHGFYREYDRGGNLIVEGDYLKGERWSGEFFLNVEWNVSDSDQFGVEGYYTISPSSASQTQQLGHFEYVEGVWNGKAIIYDDKGQIINEVNHTNGVLDGASIWYYEDGNVFMTMEWNLGKIDGEIIVYAVDGTEVAEIIYENGKCIERCTDPYVAVSGNDRLVGVWATLGVDQTLGEVEVNMELRPDGTLIMAMVLASGARRSFKGTWSDQGDELELRSPYFTPDGESRVRWKIEGLVLVLEDSEGRQQEWQRKD